MIYRLRNKNSKNNNNNNKNRQNSDLKQYNIAQAHAYLLLPYMGYSNFKEITHTLTHGSKKMQILT